MNFKDRRLIKLIALSPIFVIVVFLIIAISILIDTHKNNLQKAILDIESHLIIQGKDSTRIRVDSIVDLVKYQEEVLQAQLKKRVKDRVDTAYKIANKVYAKHKDDSTEDDIKKLIKNILRPLVWNSGESFIWALDYDGIFQLAPNYLRDLEGESILYIQDINGRYVIQDEINICKKFGGGFLWNTFIKPSDSSNQYRQLAYVRDLGVLNWYIGSSEYIDTASEAIDRVILDSIRKVSQDSKNYIFVFNSNWKLLVNGAIPSLEGVDLRDSEDNIKLVIDKIFNNLKTQDSFFVEYDWLNIHTNRVEKKMSYISKVPNSNLIIGSGFYYSDIRKESKERVDNLYQDYKFKINNIIFVGIISAILLLIPFYLLSKYIERRFLIYQNNIDNKNYALNKLNNSLSSEVIQRTKELEKSKKQLEILATIDSLTNINNRYSIMRILDHELNSAKRYNHNVSIIMYDIDFFKKINDNYGHHIGDEVLRDMTSLIKSELRKSDFIGRYGGEEFLIILPFDNLQRALIVANRIKNRVSNHIFNEVGTITISLGLVEFNLIESSDELFIRLDKLLYRSKNEGRNRVTY